MEQSGNEKIKHKSKNSVVKRIFSWKNILYFCVCAAVLFLAVEYTSKAIALHGTDTLDDGASVISEADGALTVSSIPDVDDIWQFSEEFSALNATHKEWTNIEKDSSQTGFFCIAEDKSEVCVYNIDQNNICDKMYTLNDFNYIWVDSNSGSFYTVINLSGRVVDLSDYYILVRDYSPNLATRVVINCYEAEEVLLKNTALTGTLVAPNAHVTYENTVVNGQVYALSSSGSRSEYNDIAFTGYNQVLTYTSTVEFENEAARAAAVSWLKTNYSLLYSDYSESFVPGEVDLLRITDLNLDGVTANDLGRDLSYMKNLTYFTCTNSTVGAIDLTGLEKIIEVDLSGTSATEVNLSSQKNLIKLTMNKTSVSDIDVSACTKLASISYEGSSVETVKFPENSQIIYINCSDTDFRGFTDENISALSSLLYLEAENNPNLGSIDLSRFPLLKKVNLTNCGLGSISFAGCNELYYAKCSSNGFTEVDLSNSAVLTYFEAYSSVLKTVYVTGKHKEDFAAVYVYDTVQVTGWVEDPPEAQNGGEDSQTESANQTGT